MGNNLEFLLSLNDKFSVAFKAVGIVSGNVSSQISSGLNKVNESAGKMATNLSVGFNKATQQGKELEKQIEKLSNKAERSNSAFGSGWASKLMAAASAGAIMSFASSSVNAAMNFGATSKSFEVLAGSSEKGKELANRLNKLQQDTILGPEVFHNAQTLMSFGITASKVIGIEKQLGDVSMGNKEKFDALTLAFAQTHAAGRLMGQDLLQYINAGFNPLQTMSERWKDFGFKSQMSVGQLKQAMEKGLITSDMVAKSFELATSKGGKFANMMDVIGTTSYGKMKILEGSWENLKIQTGNVLMPLANEFMNAATSVLGFFNVSKTIPETLVGEKLEINSLVKSILNLNQGNQVRTQLLNTLKVNYPDLFGKIDTEKVKNSELLTTLDKINSAYGKRIQLASYDLIADTAKKDINNLLELATKAQAQADYMKTHTGFGDKFKYLSVVDHLKVAMNGGASDMTEAGLRTFSQYAMKQVESLQKTKATAEGTRQALEIRSLISSAFGLDHSANKAKILGKNLPGFNQEMNELRLLNAANGGKIQGSLLNHDFSKLRSFMNGDSNGSTSDSNSLAGVSGDGGKSKAQSINDGGQRSIVINIGKMIERQDFHVMSAGEASNELEAAIREGVRRVLYSLNGVATN